MENTEMTSNEMVNFAKQVLINLPADLTNVNDEMIIEAIKKTVEKQLKFAELLKGNSDMMYAFGSLVMSVI